VRVEDVVERVGVSPRHLQQLLREPEGQHRRSPPPARRPGEVALRTAPDGIDSLPEAITRERRSESLRGAEGLGTRTSADGRKGGLSIFALALKRKPVPGTRLEMGALAGQVVPGRQGFGRPARDRMTRYTPRAHTHCPQFGPNPLCTGREGALPQVVPRIVASPSWRSRPTHLWPSSRTVVWAWAG
jgi:hypothetical protein